MDHFSPKLYTLASEVHNCLQAYSQHFPNLAKKKASNIHTIGKLIAYPVLTSTAFQWRTMGFNLQKNPEFANQASLYFLSQREVILFCHQKYSNTMSETKNFTLDDKVRVAGMFL